MITLETAKKLKEAGWSKETNSVWEKQVGFSPIPIPANEMKNYDLGSVEYVYPCPSLEELLAEMPESLNVHTYWFFLEKFAGKYYALYRNVGFSPLRELISDPNPSEAVALLWLKLQSENLLDKASELGGGK